MSIIFSRITIYGHLTLHFHTLCNSNNHCFSTCLESKIFTFIFLNFVFFINFAKDSGYKSDDGVSHKSLAKIIFCIVFNLFFTSFSFCLFTRILTISSFLSDLYLSNLYLDKNVASTNFNNNCSFQVTKVNFSGKVIISSHKNSITVFVEFLE
ncbi:MAG: hypothetical protein Q8S84_08010 [bacterium]|nr:hypothetical protein [bacterium]MDP3381382.1 hypothetical protein [bacterium]